MTKKETKPIQKVKELTPMEAVENMIGDFFARRLVLEYNITHRLQISRYVYEHIEGSGAFSLLDMRRWNYYNQMPKYTAAYVVDRFRVDEEIIEYWNGLRFTDDINLITVGLNKTLKGS